MEVSALQWLLNNIDSFLNLSASSSVNLNNEPLKRYYQIVEEILKLLTPVLDAVTEIDDDLLKKAFLQLAQSVDESIDLFKIWHPLASRLTFVLEAESLTTNIRRCVTEILQSLKLAHETRSGVLTTASPDIVQKCSEKVESILCGQSEAVISDAIKDEAAGIALSPDRLKEITDLLGIESNQEIFIEAVALEKLKENAEQAENKEDMEFYDHIISLIMQFHDHLVAMKHSENSNPVPIPPDLCCPLSLDLMTDPVIVSSGQTYERVYITKWLDLGLDYCPKTRQPLGRTSLTPNFTVKALVASWCEHNNVNFPEPRIVSSSSMVEQIKREKHPSPRIVSSPSMDPRPDLNEVENQVKRLLEDLNSCMVERQREAASELRVLAKKNMDNRVIISNCEGAIASLINLLHSTDSRTQDNAVTTLLNLSLSDNNKSTIANSGAIEPLIHVLKTGSTEAKGNAAATLFSLSVIEENKLKIGKSGAIGPLVDLLANGTLSGKKDATTALYNLSILHENKAKIVEAGAVGYLIELMDPGFGMVDKAVAALANLATVQEGKNAIGQLGGIPLLVEVVELGSARGKENAAATLLQLCMVSTKFCSIALQEGVVPPVVALSQLGTARAKEKAQALLNCFRNHRHGSLRRV